MSAIALVIIQMNYTFHILFSRSHWRPFFRFVHYRHVHDLTRTHTPADRHHRVDTRSDPPIIRLEPSCTPRCTRQMQR